MLPTLPNSRDQIPFLPIQPQAAYFQLPPLPEEEIIEHCRERLASYKKPSVVEFRESLPKNAMQKVLKTVLREAAIKKP
jgi:acyl-CoA synthetase (AMP-forming)/AMP-acid ligase II